MTRVSKISRYFTVKHNLTFHANCLKRGIHLPIYLLVNLSDFLIYASIMPLGVLLVKVLYKLRFFFFFFVII